MNPDQAVQKQVVLVEDEPFIKDLYLYALTKAGINVIPASDGLTALDLIKRQYGLRALDLILLDIMLPRLNGIEVLKALKKDPQLSSVPVVLITNLGSEEIIKQAFELGAQGYLMKARVTPNQIVEQVKVFLNNPSYSMDPNDLEFD